MRQKAIFIALVVLAGAGAWLAPASRALACPFCTAVSPSMSDRLEVARFAIVARISGNPHPDNPLIREVEFVPVRFLRGSVDEFGGQTIMAPIPLNPEPGGEYFTMGAPEVDTAEPAAERLVWTLPVPISRAAAEYITRLDEAPASGPKRLAYFIPHLNSPNSLIDQDVYDEFGASPYEDVKAIADLLPRQELLRWIADDSIAPLRRRLYLTLLGVCGEQSDAELVLSEITQRIAGSEMDRTLDAMIACYLTLVGEAGLATIDALILTNDQLSMGSVQSAILALRFHGEEETLVSRQRLLQSMRLLLDRPEVADLVIRDLARWEDWSVVDRLVEMFREARPEHQFLRVPIIKYLQVCPLPAAEAAIVELGAEYPDVVRRAKVLPFELGRRRARIAKTDERQRDTPPENSDSAQPTDSGSIENSDAAIDSGDTADPDVEPKPAGAAGDAASDDGGEVAADPAAQAGDETTEETAAEGRERPGPKPPMTNTTLGLIMAGAALLLVFVFMMLLRS